MRHRLQALSLAVALAALLAIKPLPAHAEKVQIDPNYNTIQCANCSAGGGTSLTPATTSAGGIAPVASTAVEACHVLKASAGNLYGFTLNATSTASANDWVLVFNAASAPADGAVTPVDWGRVNPNGFYSWAMPAIPVYFSTGITVCLSTTGPLTKTAEAQAVISGKVQ